MPSNSRTKQGTIRLWGFLFWLACSNLHHATSISHAHTGVLHFLESGVTWNNDATAGVSLGHGELWCATFLVLAFPCGITVGVAVANTAFAWLLSKAKHNYRSPSFDPESPDHRARQRQRQTPSCVNTWQVLFWSSRQNAGFEPYPSPRWQGGTHIREGTDFDSTLAGFHSVNARPFTSFITCCLSASSISRFVLLCSTESAPQLFQLFHSLPGTAAGEINGTSPVADRIACWERRL